MIPLRRARDLGREIVGVASCCLLTSLASKLSTDPFKETNAITDMEFLPRGPTLAMVTPKGYPVANRRLSGVRVALALPSNC